MYKFPDQLNPPFMYTYARQPSFCCYLMKVPVNLYYKNMEHCAYTDGKGIYCGKEYFETLNKEPQAYVICHEIGHIMLRHGELHKKWQEDGTVTGTLRNGTVITYPWVNWIMQHSFDFLINDMLLCAGFPLHHAPKELLWNPTVYGGWKDRECDIYVRYYAAQKHKQQTNPQPQLGSATDKSEGNGQPQPGHGQGSNKAKPDSQGNNGNPIDSPVNQSSLGKPQDSKPGHNGQPYPSNNKPCNGGADVLPSNPMDRDPLAEMVLREAMDILQKQRGSMAGGIEALLDRVAPTRVHWESFIKPRIRAICGTGKRTWDRLDTYSMAVPMIVAAKTGRRAGTMCLAMDTSGSVSKNERCHWLGAFQEIIKRFMPRRLVLLEVDARVARVTEITKPSQMNIILADIKKGRRGMAGNGGTDMREIDKWLVKNDVHPELTVILTDGWTPFPYGKGNSRDVVWVITSEKKAPESAGKTVRMDVVHH